MNKPEYIVVHHTATPRDRTTVEAVDRFHRDKDWGGGIRCLRSRIGYYVQYHWFIEPFRTIHCADDNEVRWHAGASANMRSIAISMTGWFDPGHDSGPTDTQFSELGRLISFYMQKYGISLSKVVGHRYFMNKTCPGTLVNDTLIRSLPGAVNDGEEVELDYAFATTHNGRIIVDVEDHGRKWYVWENLRHEIDKAPEFELGIRENRVPAVWMKHADVLRIPKG